MAVFEVTASDGVAIGDDQADKPVPGRKPHRFTCAFDVLAASHGEAVRIVADYLREASVDDNVAPPKSIIDGIVTVGVYDDGAPEGATIN